MEKIYFLNINDMKNIMKLSFNGTSRVSIEMTANMQWFSMSMSEKRKKESLFESCFSRLGKVCKILLSFENATGLITSI